MISIGTAEHGRLKRRHLKLANGFEYFKGEWLESDQHPLRSPTVFLVEQPPHSVLPTHFHTQNEFQVVVQGSGMFGRHPVREISVHYAGAYTGYGPIVAGPEGLSYFTIRSVYESGAHFLPEGKAKLRMGPKDQRYSEAIDPLDAEALARLAASEQRELLEDGGGVASRLLRLAPRAALRSAHSSPSNGQFLMVLAGTLRYQERELGRLEMLFVPPEDADALQAVAGSGGAEVLVLQIPPQATVYLDEPQVLAR